MGPLKRNDIDRLEALFKGRIESLDMSISISKPNMVHIFDNSRKINQALLQWVLNLKNKLH